MINTKSLSSVKILSSNDSSFLPEEPLGEDILKNKEKYRVWIPKSPVVVLGRSQKADKELIQEKILADKVPVFRRYGGGGTVFLNSSSICFTIKYKRKNHLWHLDRYLSYNCHLIQEFLKDSFSLETEMKNNYDLVIKEKKFLGSSLYMSKESVLYYAVILWDKDALILINKYLSYPSKAPQYRQNRTHQDFLIALSELINLTQEDFTDRFSQFLREKLL